ncbi:MULTISPECIES: metallophosphoesterase family protein [Nocardia]|uniref:metallophosphoesterase family protein n=1 Tax=Nocardia TaxID=1817 RepID=UPI0007A42551|nr:MULTISPECIES: metallophosphoesterase family protein [Nocardia]
MTGIWFTSDQHVGGHEKVFRLRGFDSAEEHDAELARRWDEVVKPNDRVYLGGDLTGQRGHEQRGLAWAKQRPGRKILIWGNHDPGHGHHSQAHKWQRPYLEVFEATMETAVIKILGHRVLISHFPYAGPDGDHTETLRYPEYRMADTGRWLIHGHTHSSRQVRGRQLHVGVDAHDLTPVPLRWVQEQIEKEKNDV